MEIKSKITANLQKHDVKTRDDTISISNIFPLCDHIGPLILRKIICIGTKMHIFGVLV